MEIQHNQKEYSKILVDKITITGNILKEFKIYFLELSKQKSCPRIQSFTQSIEQGFRQISQNLCINEKKVLRAYLSYHLQNGSERCHMQKSQKCTQRKTFNLYSNKQQQKNRYHNILLQIFKNWFILNNHSYLNSSLSLLNKQSLLNSSISFTQQLIIKLSQKLLEKKQNQQKKNILKQFKNSQKLHSNCNANKISNYFHCQITLILILTSQINLCILLLSKSQYKAVKVILSKAQLSCNKLKQQIERKENNINQNISIIEQLNKQQEREIKKYHLGNRKKELISGCTIINKLMQRNNRNNIKKNKNLNVQRQQLKNDYKQQKSKAKGNLNLKESSNEKSNWKKQNSLINSSNQQHSQHNESNQGNQKNNQYLHSNVKSSSKLSEAELYKSEQQITEKYQKSIDQVLSRNKQILEQKIKLELFVSSMLQSMIRIYSQLYFKQQIYPQIHGQTYPQNNGQAQGHMYRQFEGFGICQNQAETKNTDNISSGDSGKLQSFDNNRNMKVIKLFEQQKLNKVLLNAFNPLYSHNNRIFSHNQTKKHHSKSQSTSPQQDKILKAKDLCQMIFSTQSSTQKSIYLSVQRSNKNLQISLKDYFNLSLLLKTQQLFKQSIIYFQILVYHYKKKQILKQYCLKQLNSNFKINLNNSDTMNDDNDQIQSSNDDQNNDQQQEHSYDSTMQNRKSLISLYQKSFNKFIRNQQLVKILLLSLVNLIDLYQIENAHYWQLKTLKYVKEIIQEKILSHLQNLRKNLQQQLCNQLNGVIYNNEDLGINQENKNNHYQNQSESENQHQKQNKKERRNNSNKNGHQTKSNNKSYKINNKINNKSSMQNSLICNQIRKAISHYNKYLQQINYKIIKNSFNVISHTISNQPQLSSNFDNFSNFSNFSKLGENLNNVNEVLNNVNRNQYQRKTLSNAVTPRISNKTSPRIQKLQEKQNQLNFLINSTKNSNFLGKNPSKFSNNSNELKDKVQRNKISFNSKTCNITCTQSPIQSSIQTSIQTPMANQCMQQDSVNFQNKKLKKYTIDKHFQLFALNNQHISNKRGKTGTKGAAYHTKNINNKRNSADSLLNNNQELKKASQLGKIKSPNSNQNEKILKKNEICIPQTIKLKQKQKVAFSLSPLDNCQTSITEIGTITNIEGGSRKIQKNHTLNFLQTSKSINIINKTTRLFQYRQKLLQNREQLQQYLKLSLNKLNTYIKSPYNNITSISLNQLPTTTTNYDITLHIDQLLNDFNELLLSLKTFTSHHHQQSFQRNLLIQAKWKLIELIKYKAYPQKLIQIYQQLINVDLPLLKNTSNKLKLKKKLLWQLSSTYYKQNHHGQCINTYLELARLGEAVGYMKMGDVYMIRKDYANAIRYYQKYGVQKNFDIETKIKLAHAYSKVPQYYMKSMDMLVGMLIMSGNSSKFKAEIIQRRHPDHLIQSAVILLSSLHFKNQSIDKSIQLCQNYCKINIKNYRIMHLLGGYYRQLGKKKKSFQSYINALQNNPSYHKSLIQITQFICQGNQYKSHAIDLLRKCYTIENRNFQLLKTLIRFLGDSIDIENRQTNKYSLFRPKKQDNNRSYNNNFNNSNASNIGKNQLSSSLSPMSNAAINYQTLLKYAQILMHSKSKGYSGQNFYQQSSLVYEWALQLLDKNITMGNLDQIQLIYKNLGEICLLKGDYIKSQTYYKLYLIQMEKYINRSHLNQMLRTQKISKTKMEIYYLLGKVKKQQLLYKKSIQYFTRSYQIQKKFQTPLSNIIQSYLHWFEIGYCYFQLEQYQLALSNFLEHKSYLLQIITINDDAFFKSERKVDVELPSHLISYLNLNANNNQSKAKTNVFKQIKLDQQNQSSSTHLLPQNHEQSQQLNIQSILKRNYFQNQLFIAFCYDKQCSFMESKEIYKKILQFLQDAQQTIKQKQNYRKLGKKPKQQQSINCNLKEQKQKQRTFMQMTNHNCQLNQQFRQFKKVSIVNLANIYKIQGMENKYKELMEDYFQLYPENYIHKSTLFRAYQQQVQEMEQGTKFEGRASLEKKNLFEKRCFRRDLSLQRQIRNEKKEQKSEKQLKDSQRQQNSSQDESQDEYDYDYFKISLNDSNETTSMFQYNMKAGDSKINSKIDEIQQAY